MSVQLKFTSTERSQLETELIAYCNQDNEIFIQITDTNCSYYLDSPYICLDKQTAIKLAKELRRQISMLEV